MKLESRLEIKRAVIGSILEASVSGGIRVGINPNSPNTHERVFYHLGTEYMQPDHNVMLELRDAREIVIYTNGHEKKTIYKRGPNPVEAGKSRIK